jgi:hypothetical protein
MKVENFAVNKQHPLSTDDAVLPCADVVLYFISPDFAEKEEFFKTLRARYPKAWLMGCSTGGEIFGDAVLNSSAVVSAIELQSTKVQGTSIHMLAEDDAYTLGKKLAERLAGPRLRYVLLLSDGIHINGSELTRSMSEALGDNVTISGGMAADGPNFIDTQVGLDALPQSGMVAAIGFYGEHFTVSTGSYGGWLEHGPVHRITSSHNNEVYRMDNQPALDLYRSYLGELSQNLPGSGLLYPFSINPSDDVEHSIVRTVVSINEQEKSLTFAGDVPAGYTARLMHGSTENLVKGAEIAARNAVTDFMSKMDKSTSANKIESCLGILVSCIGRNILMAEDVHLEAKAVSSILKGVPIIGFYSYGEICPHGVTHRAGLHNQTMTITLLSEAS